MNFAKSLKYHMNKKDITQKQLSDLTGLSKSGISQYVSGTYVPSYETKRKLADALGIEVSDFDIEIEAEVKYKGNKVTPEEAAPLLEMSVQSVRKGLQQGTMPFGFAVLNKRWAYNISRHLLNQYLGKETDSETAV